MMRNWRERSLQTRPELVTIKCFFYLSLHSTCLCPLITVDFNAVIFLFVTYKKKIREII